MVSSGSSWDEIWTHLPRGFYPYWFAYEAGFLFLLFTFPALVFHFVEEFFTGRHLLASEEVLGLAFEILAEGGEKMPPEFLQEKLEKHPQHFPRAIRLLLEMKLVIPSRTDRGALLLSMRGLELMES